MSQGIVTQSLAPLTHVMIPGAQKSATSTLFSWLDGHPQCRMSRLKEPMFFSRSGPWSKEKYAACFPDDRSDTAVRVIGEASTTYLSVPEAAPRIADTLGTATKFVVVLRDPAERAVSAYWHMTKRFHEFRSPDEVLQNTVRNLADRLVEEQQRIAVAESTGRIVTHGYQERLGDSHWPFRYLRNSCYLHDLKRFEQLFGRTNLLVLLTDDMQFEPVATWRRVADFLEIDRDIIPPVVGERHNITIVPPQSPMLNTLARGVAVVPFIGHRLRRRIPVIRGGRPPELSQTICDSLRELFASHNAALADYLKRDLSCWSSDAKKTSDRVLRPPRYVA